MPKLVEFVNKIPSVEVISIDVTSFKLVSPPPYLNVRAEEFLSWVIESTFNYIDSIWVKDMIQSRLPNPIDDEKQWIEEWLIWFINKELR